MPSWEIRTWIYVISLIAAVSVLIVLWAIEKFDVENPPEEKHPENPERGWWM
jgi:hypothetical protein